MHTNLKKNITIVFHSNESLKENEYGFCSILDDNKRPREFLIDLNPKYFNNKKKIMKVIAHELVHVKQFAKKELIFNAARIKYLKQYYNYSNKLSDYYNHPWEIEAYGREKGLFLRFVYMKKGIQYD